VRVALRVSRSRTVRRARSMYTRETRADPGRRAIDPQSGRPPIAGHRPTLSTSSAAGGIVRWGATSCAARPPGWLPLTGEDEEHAQALVTRELVFCARGYEGGLPLGQRDLLALDGERATSFPRRRTIRHRRRVTPSLRARSRATQYLLQIGPFGGLGMRRDTSRVSFLMCPFCVRALVPSPTTHGANEG
jgi:hypothetical protein